MKEAITSLLLRLTPWYKQDLPTDPEPPDIFEQYFGRVGKRFQRFRVFEDEKFKDKESEFGRLIHEAQERFEDWGPTQITSIHGDPNPENVFWDGNKVTLIDPKDWKRGDYIFDMAKIGHYFRVTAQIERGLPKDKAAELEKHLCERVNDMDIEKKEETAHGSVRTCGSLLPHWHCPNAS